MDLGFASGDSVVNTYPGNEPRPESEVDLVCKIGSDTDGELWWAWCDRERRMCTVSCGKWWVLYNRRTVWRNGTPYWWDDEKWREGHGGT